MYRAYSTICLSLQVCFCITVTMLMNDNKEFCLEHCFSSPKLKQIDHTAPNLGEGGEMEVSESMLFWSC